MFGTISTVSLLVWVLTTSLYKPIDAGNETASTIKVGTQNHRIDQNLVQSSRDDC